METKKGGRGKCCYCKEWHNNVSYHQACECKKRPILGGDKIYELRPIQSDGGGLHYVEPGNHPDFPKDGKI
jgi:hypothetical protein